MRYECPFCYKTMPEGYVPSAWSCCGEVGHAVAMASDTPITDKIIADADACPETRIVFLIKHLANKCREFERLYNAALICAGVASLERSEWETERDYLRAKFGELRFAAEQVLCDWANENVVRCDSRQRVERVLNSVDRF